MNRLKPIISLEMWLQTMRFGVSPVAFHFWRSKEPLFPNAPETYWWSSTFAWRCQ